MLPITTMLAVDLRRMFRSKLFYILLAACLVMPILILVMTTMMDGTVTIDPQTGAKTVIEGFDNVWQIISSLSGSSMAMDMTAMCNMNLLYFLLCVPVCIFVAQDFRSGYVKNIFAVRSRKAGYVLSKTLICSASAMFLLMAFVIGAFLGGKIAGLSFAMEGFYSGQLVMCLLCKLLLAPTFVAIDLCMGVIAREKAWLSVLLSLMVGMFLFTMIPMLTPLDAAASNALLCLLVSLLLCVGMGTISSILLKKRDVL